MGIFIIINYSLLFVHLFDFFSVLFLSLSRSLARSLSPTPPRAQEDLQQYADA